MLDALNNGCVLGGVCLGCDCDVVGDVCLSGVCRGGECLVVSVVVWVISVL